MGINNVNIYEIIDNPSIDKKSFLFLVKRYKYSYQTFRFFFINLNPSEGAANNTYPE